MFGGPSESAAARSSSTSSREEIREGGSSFCKVIFGFSSGCFDSLLLDRNDRNVPVGRTIFLEDVLDRKSVV